MARVRINFSGVQTANEELKKTLHAMERLEEELSDLQRQVDLKLQAQRGIGDQLSSCRNMASDLESYARKLYGVISAGEQQYRETESRLGRGVPENQKVTI